MATKSLAARMLPAACLAAPALLIVSAVASLAHAGRPPKLETRWAFRVGAASAWVPIVGDTDASVPISVPAGNPWGCSRQRVQTSADGRYVTGSIICAYGDAMAIASVQCAVAGVSADTSTLGISTMKGGPTVLLNVQCETRPVR
jgi:hypothetical protein